jgi:hypothetical protein
MGCLSSENLKEREEVLVSSVMVAQRAGGYWSTLLTLTEGEVQVSVLRKPRIALPETRDLAPETFSSAHAPSLFPGVSNLGCEQSCTE